LVSILLVQLHLVRQTSHTGLSPSCPHINEHHVSP
jgi:hypothetical protein